MTRGESPSLPSRERGLKYLDFTEILQLCVAPFAGAWIEIDEQQELASYVFVAPFAGAWIEIGYTRDR